jgi:hypothetical protein
MNRMCLSFGKKENEWDDQEVKELRYGGSHTPRRALASVAPSEEHTCVESWF